MYYVEVKQSPVRWLSSEERAYRNHRRKSAQLPGLWPVVSIRSFLATQPPDPGSDNNKRFIMMTHYSSSYDSHYSHKSYLSQIIGYTARTALPAITASVALREMRVAIRPS